MFFGLLAIFIIVSLILPWVNLSRIITLEKENREIRALLLNKEKTPQPIIDEGGIVKKPQHQESFSAISEPNVGGIKRKITDISPHHATSPIPLISESPAAKKVSFEQRFGKRLPVWIGGIALAFAGLFMVKYSIDAGILTAGLRVILGVAFGIALLGLGKFIHSHKDFANKEKISQAFVGAGLVDLYACVFVAVNIYHFISPAFGFGVMILIMSFALLSLNIRQIYHGEYLDRGVTTNAETYTYSVMWLLLGIGLLFGGTIKKNKMLRVSALCLIIMTVIKVFFYDASELTGLYRVFSFLGLGFSLIGLSWFYTKYISDSSGS